MSLKPEALYAELCKIPTVTEGFLVSQQKKGMPAIMLRQSQKDLVNDEVRSSLINFVPTGNEESYTPQPFPSEVRDVAAMIPSPSGRYLAIVRNRVVKGNKEQSLEVWDGGSLIATVSGNGVIHDAVYSGDVFSSLQWDNDETRILYVAERKAKEVSSFWQSKPATSDEGEGAKWGGSAFEQKKNRGEEFTFIDDWGELCTGKSVSRLFVLHLPSGGLQQVCAPEEGWAAGQGVWAPGGTGIVFTAFAYEPRRLGVRFYNTRKSKLCYADAPVFSQTSSPGVQGIKASSCERSKDTASAVTITPEEDWSARSPRFSPDGRKLAYVVSANSDAHFSSSKLCVADWKGSESATSILTRKVVIDIVQRPASDESFPGLFTSSEQLPRRIWLADSRRVVLHSDWRSQRQLLVVDTEAQGPSAVSCIEAGSLAGAGSWVLLDVAGSSVLASRGSPSSPSSAYLLKVGDASGGTCKVDKVMPISGLVPTSKSTALVKDIDWRVLKVKPPGDNLSFEALLVQSKDACQAGGKVPLVVYPHGGPHSNQGVDFYPGVTMLALQGYAVLVVNYRGSTGFGQELVDCLCGKVGRQDVDDVMQAAKQCLAECPHIDADAVLACGGSHGGFLSLHLVGQYPEFFKAAAVRNPVTNIVSMFGQTDIPDWCYTEIGVEPAYAQPTSEQYVKAFDMSPIRYISKVTSPVLLLVGGADRRVPPSQSKEYYHAMRQRGASCEMKWYPDHTHGLMETPRGEGDGLVHIVNFFNKALGKTPS